jgi:hypothetical protein
LRRQVGPLVRDAPPSGTLRAIVAIPVRNEAAMIGACLDALLD